MRSGARDGGNPGIDRPVVAIGGAGKRRKGDEDGVVLIGLLVDVLDEAERHGDEGRRIALRVGRRRDVFAETVAGERRVEGRRKDRQQRHEHQEGPREAAMETGLTQNDPPGTSVSMFHI